ncbi:flagellar hook-basal body complex protein FliE [Pseudaeromonas sp. ZJS20]|uniref:flagellar hook-basal body complex protein FliE n=1 Tax=Pseudaeromonas aegiceratis TaxID=3153928 RepID=UPI00390C59EE
MSIEAVTAGNELMQQMRVLAAEAASIAPAAPEPALGGGVPADFASYMQASIQGVNAQQLDASARMQAVEAGESTDLVGTMISSQKASLSFSALVQVRNKLMSGLDDIMDMAL